VCGCLGQEEDPVVACREVRKSAAVQRQTMLSTERKQQCPLPRCLQPCIPLSSNMTLLSVVLGIALDQVQKDWSGIVGSRHCLLQNAQLCCNSGARYAEFQNASSSVHCLAASILAPLETAPQAYSLLCHPFINSCVCLRQTGALQKKTVIVLQRF